jgi:hypothetical protein
MSATDERMQIDFSGHPVNADSPRFEVLQPDSNVRFESHLQGLKHALEIISSDDGMQIG